MPSQTNQALLLQLDVFLAENNIRNGVLSVATNSASPGNTFLERSLDVPANGTKVFTCEPGNSCLVVRALKPVTATITRTVGLVTTTSVIVINSLLVLSDYCTSISFANANTTDVATLRIVQI